MPGADVAAVNNAARGLRADLPEGPLTFGRLYDVFPFDNRIARITLTGAELGRWVAGEIRQGRLGSLGLAGVEVRTRCLADGLHVDLFRGDATDSRRRSAGCRDDRRADAERRPGVNAIRSAGVGPIGNAPVAREVVEDWFRRLGPTGQARLDAWLGEARRASGIVTHPPCAP